jgi:hypothetical protein
MVRSVCTAVIVSALATPAFADVTITSQVTGKGLGKAAESQSITYIQGMKMRTDSTLADSPASTIIDLEAQKFISVNHKKKEVQVYNLAEFRQTMEKSVSTSAAKTSMTPNGQKKEIAGKSCDGYDLSVSIPMKLGGDAEMMMVMTGPVFVAKNSPGAADYKKFYLAAAEKGFIASDPRVAKGAPQQAKGMTEMYRAMAEAGVAYSMEMSMKIEGGGPMSSMMNKVMGGTAFTNTVTALSTDPIAADKFQVPSGYNVKDAK